MVISSLASKWTIWTRYIKRKTRLGDILQSLGVSISNIIPQVPIWRRKYYQERSKPTPWKCGPDWCLLTWECFPSDVQPVSTEESNFTGLSDPSLVTNISKHSYLERCGSWASTGGKIRHFRTIGGQDINSSPLMHEEKQDRELLTGRVWNYWLQTPNA